MATDTFSIAQTLDFFASVIRCGESWTPTCQEAYDKAQQKLHAPYVDIVFDAPPGPEAGRFVEVEDSNGRDIKFGEWLQRSDNYWVLRVPQ